jgi:hypothetical protein
MNNKMNMQEKLNTVIRLKMESPDNNWPTQIWALCHDLAEAQYQPALNFFLDGLNDTAWDWRQRCLQMIGFHYEIPPNSEITDKVRKMLMSDPDVNVRMTAADVLGDISILPDPVLVNALNTDADWFVRRSAYLALLQLAGVSYEMYVHEQDRFDSEIEVPEPTIQDVKRILTEEGIEVLPTTFDSVNPSG